MGRTSKGVLNKELKIITKTETKQKKINQFSTLLILAISTHTSLTQIWQ